MAAVAKFRHEQDGDKDESAAAANDFMASPAEQVRRLYKRAEDFREELSAHLVNGYVFCSPECFVMGRAVDLRAPRETALNPWFAFPPEDVNAWLVWAAAGTTAGILSHLPYELPYLAWQRRGSELRVYEFEKCKSTIQRLTR
jgi:hypothetical protein